MNRELSMEFVRVTEAMAIRLRPQCRRGDKNGADQLAVDAMRKAFDTVNISGTVVIGEGEMDEAPMLYIGEKVGGGGAEVDIAVDSAKVRIWCCLSSPRNRGYCHRTERLPAACS